MMKPKFKIGDSVRSKAEMGRRLEVIGVVDYKSYLGYRCLDSYGKEHIVHQSLLLAFQKAMR